MKFLNPFLNAWNFRKNLKNYLQAISECILIGTHFLMGYITEC